MYKHLGSVCSFFFNNYWHPNFLNFHFNFNITSVIVKEIIQLQKHTKCIGRKKRTKMTKLSIMSWTPFLNYIINILLVFKIYNCITIFNDCLLFNYSNVTLVKQCPIINHLFILKNLAMLCGLRDLSSPTRDWTHSLVVKVWSPNRWTSREFPIVDPLWCLIFQLEK